MVKNLYAIHSRQDRNCSGNKSPNFIVFQIMNIIYFVGCRFPGAHSHYFLSDFLQSVAESYAKEDKAYDYILHLLQLDCKLLSVASGKERDGREVQDIFKKFLRNYIKRYSLKGTLSVCVIAVS